jgi:hypothetical protein
MDRVSATRRALARLATMRTLREGQGMITKIPCGCCESEMVADPDDFCHGCNLYICADNCTGSPPPGSHKPWQHKPCDTCGDAVADEGLRLCQSHLDGDT